MVDDGAAGVGAGVRQEIDGAVLFADVVQRAPAGDVGLVVGLGVIPLHVAGVLVPGELHALLGALDDPLLMEEVGVIADGGAGDLRHQVREDELVQAVGEAVAVVDEVALAAVAEVLRLHALGVHDGVVVAEVVGAILTQQVQHGWGDHGGQDEV